MNILVSGASGFAARHLIPLLIKKEKKAKTIGFYRSQKPTWIKSPRLILEQVDLLDKKRLSNLIKKYQPKEIYHLAAVVGVKELEKNPTPAFKSNILGTSNLMNALGANLSSCRILNTGSSEEYGRVSAKKSPIKEIRELKPLTAYGVSKVCQEALMRYYERIYGFKVIYTRTFHYTGPYQKKGFFFTDRLEKIKALKHAGKTIMELKNGNDRRDYSDIRDVVNAYYLLMKKGKEGEVYNVSAGKALSFKGYIEIMLKELRSDIKLKLYPQKKRSIVLGSNQKLKKDTGWRPQISIRQTVSDMLKY